MQKKRPTCWCCCCYCWSFSPLFSSHSEASVLAVTLIVWLQSARNTGHKPQWYWTFIVNSWLCLALSITLNSGNGVSRLAHNPTTKWQPTYVILKWFYSRARAYISKFHEKSLCAIFFFLCSNYFCLFYIYFICPQKPMRLRITPIG